MRSSAAGRKARRSFSAASVKPERDGADTTGSNSPPRPSKISVLGGGRATPTMLSAPRRLLTPRLDVLADAGQHVADAVAGQGQRRNGDDRDQRHDQRVLDERLPFLRLHFGEVDPRCERLIHVSSPFSPRGNTCLRSLFSRFPVGRYTRERLVSPSPSVQVFPAWVGSQVGSGPYVEAGACYQMNRGPMPPRKMAASSQHGSDQIASVPRPRRTLSGNVFAT